jgi:elongator complex protein 1
MYKETLKAEDITSKIGMPPILIESKVNRICDAFLTILEQGQYKESHWQNLITAHVCKVPADLESGLEMIGRLQGEQTINGGLHENSFNTATNNPLTERAAEHICFLADVNRLYDTSLGLYNLELALLIAQQSQKDPREYLPHLQSLSDVTLLRRKFIIDDQLDRRAKALGHLKEMNVFDEVRDYVQEHALYTEALGIYSYDATSLSVIMKLYADYLSTKNRHREAALAYEYLKDYASAWRSYRSANLWREALSSATLANLSSAELQNLATSLAEDLTESKDYISAATITLDYLSDLPNAARLLCKGHHFAEAMRLIILRNQPALIEEVVDVGLVDRSAEMTEFLADMKAQILAQVPRLADLRAKKAEDPLAFYEGVEDANIPDNISIAPTDTTSGGTFMTRYTNRTGTVNTQTTRKTSKNKRREERKRARGKKGTVYEEEYLMNSLERLIERINSMDEEIQRLIEGLLRRGMRERADAVERAVADVTGRCRDAVKEMFSSEALSNQDQTVTNGVEEADQEVLRPSGADATLWDSLAEVGKKRDAPVVKVFERLSLLG